MEDVCGVEVPEPIRQLRRLLYCGEWIESHALHVYMLHAPDFLGYDGVVELAQDEPAAVERGLALKKAGNEVMTARRRSRGAPDQRARRRLLPRADATRAADARRPARACARGGARDRPLDRRGSSSPSGWSTARSSRSRPRAATRSSAGGSPPTRASTSASREYDEHFAEEHVERSSALHSRLRNGGDLPVRAARTLRAQRRRPLAARARGGARGRRRAALPRPVPEHRRPRRRDRLRLRRGPAPARGLRGAGRAVRAGRAGRRRRLRRDRGAARAPATTGTGSTRTARSSRRRSSRRRPRTSWRSRATCARSWDATRELPDEELRELCEQTIRNYDPCISCATHFLDLEVERL